MIKKINKRAQEEIIGFGIILVIIAVIALIFIAISANKNESSDNDFEVSGFLNALMEKTTTCEKNSDFTAVKDLIFECGSGGGTCENGEEYCDILEETIKNAMKDNWKFGEEEVVKGYSILVYYEEGLIINETKGSSGTESRGAMQDYAKPGENAQIFLEIYN